jgi:hypothetical protein
MVMKEEAAGGKNAEPGEICMVGGKPECERANGGPLGSAIACPSVSTNRRFSQLRFAACWSKMRIGHRSAAFTVNPYEERIFATCGNPRISL